MITFESLEHAKTDELLDSSGIGEIVAAHTWLLNNDGGLVLVTRQTPILYLLSLTKIDKAIPVCGTLKDALRHFDIEFEGSGQECEKATAEWRSNLQTSGLELPWHFVDLGVAIEVGGRLTLGMAPVQLRQQVSELIEKGCRGIALVMTDVTYIDSIGLNVVMDCFTRMSNANGFFCIVNPRKRVRDLLAIVKIPSTVPIFETVEASCFYAKNRV